MFLVPSGVDDKELVAAVEKILATRERQRDTWHLREEAVLIEEEAAIRAETRDRVASLLKRRQELADLRVAVMRSNVNLARAVKYYENGSSSRPIDSAMHDLYKLVELLEDYFGGSEEKLAAALNVPKALFKDGIKRLANQTPLNFRHAKSGKTEGADVAKVDQARDAAHTLVQLFIEYCCAEELEKRAAQAKAGGSSR